MWPFANKSIKDEIIGKQSRQIEELKRLRFRVGDAVYINDGVRNPLGVYYLVEPYNGGDCYYVSKNKDILQVNHATQNGAHISKMSHNPPDRCKCCGNIL